MRACGYFGRISRSRYLQHVSLLLHALVALEPHTLPRRRCSVSHQDISRGLPNREEVGGHTLSVSQSFLRALISS
jgi:hypothetical protein